MKIQNYLFKISCVFVLFLFAACSNKGGDSSTITPSQAPSTGVQTPSGGGLQAPTPSTGAGTTTTPGTTGTTTPGTGTTTPSTGTTQPGTTGTGTTTPGSGGTAVSPTLTISASGLLDTLDYTEAQRFVSYTSILNTYSQFASLQQGQNLLQPVTFLRSLYGSSSVYAVDPNIHGGIFRRKLFDGRMVVATLGTGWIFTLKANPNPQQGNFDILEVHNVTDVNIAPTELYSGDERSVTAQSYPSVVQSGASTVPVPILLSSGNYDRYIDFQSHAVSVAQDYFNSDLLYIALKTITEPPAGSVEPVRHDILIIVFDAAQGYILGMWSLPLDYGQGEEATSAFVMDPVGGNIFAHIQKGSEHTLKQFELNYDQSNNKLTVERKDILDLANSIYNTILGTSYQFIPAVPHKVLLDYDIISQNLKLVWTDIAHMFSLQVVRGNQIQIDYNNINSNSQKVMWEGTFQPDINVLPSMANSSLSAYSFESRKASVLSNSGKLYGAMNAAHSRGYDSLFETTLGLMGTGGEIHNTPFSDPEFILTLTAP